MSSVLLILALVVLVWLGAQWSDAMKRDAHKALVAWNKP